MAKEIESDEFKKLITLGEEKGFLTYDDVNDLLPSDVISSDQIDDIIMLFGEKNIDIIDTDKGEKLVVKKTADERVDSKSEDLLGLLPAVGKTGDPVKMYLREMGLVSLLSREGEVEIAKVIEEGAQESMEAVFSVTVFPQGCGQYRRPVEERGDPRQERRGQSRGRRRRRRRGHASGSGHQAARQGDGPGRQERCDPEEAERERAQRRGEAETQRGSGQEPPEYRQALPEGPVQQETDRPDGGQSPRLSQRGGAGGRDGPPVQEGNGSFPGPVGRGLGEDEQVRQKRGAGGQRKRGYPWKN